MKVRAFIRRGLNTYIKRQLQKRKERVSSRKNAVRTRNRNKNKVKSATASLDEQIEAINKRLEASENDKDELAKCLESVEEELEHANNMIKELEVNFRRRL